MESPDDLPKGLFLNSHPLIAHKMTLLRNKDTSPHDYRRLLREITFYLGYEATRGLSLCRLDVTTPIGHVYQGSKLSESITVIPILRAGLGMVDGMLDLMPKAAVHHIGMYKNKSSTLPVLYYNRLPKDRSCEIAFLLDVCVASGTTMQAVISIVKSWGAKKIVVIAALGYDLAIRKLLAAYPDVTVVIGALDSHISSDGLLVPGAGDAGDRLFGTPIEDAIVIDINTAATSSSTTTGTEHNSENGEQLNKKRGRENDDDISK